jgi:hypothetical protein
MQVLKILFVLAEIKEIKNEEGTKQLCYYGKIDSIAEKRCSFSHGIVKQ